MEPSNEELNAIEQQDILEDALPTLEDLFAEASPVAKPRRDPSKFPLSPSHTSYTNPENWQRTRGVAIFHKETNTLLGNFSEYKHKTAAGCRKLVRESAPIAVSGSEYVEGNWWLPSAQMPEARKPWQETRLAMMKVHMPDLNVFAPLVELKAYLEHGGIARVELTVETQFADADGNQLLFLPAGTNILPCMTLDGKIALRQEIGL